MAEKVPPPPLYIILVTGLQRPQIAAQHGLQFLHKLPLMFQDVLDHLGKGREF